MFIAGHRVLKLTNLSNIFSENMALCYEYVIYIVTIGLLTWFLPNATRKKLETKEDLRGIEIPYNDADSVIVIIR